MKKISLIILGTITIAVLVIGGVYLLRKPSTPTITRPSSTATPKISPKPDESAQPIEVLVVDSSIAACTQTFTVACGSANPSPSSSLSPSPSVSPVVSPSILPSVSPSPALSADLKCVSKKMYRDDARNRAGFYYLEREITDANTVESGEVIVYNVLSRNNGGNSVPDTMITDKLSTSLVYIDGDSGCSYDSATRVVSCLIGTLSPSSEAQRSFRAKVNVESSSSVANTAQVTSTNGQRDSCSINIDATGKVVLASPEAPTELPQAGVFEITTGTLGIGLLLLILGALGLLMI